MNGNSRPRAAAVGTIRDSSRYQCRYRQLGGRGIDTYDLYAAQNNTGAIRLREKRYLDAANCFCQAVKCINERSTYQNHCTENAECCHEASCRDSDCDNQFRNSARDSRQSQSSSSSSSSLPELQSQTSTESSNEGSIPSINSEINIPDFASRNIIESFYLLLDEEISARASDAEQSLNTSEGSSLGNASNQEYPRQSYIHNSGVKTRNPERKCQAVQSSGCNGTFVFKNPILVSKRGLCTTKTHATIDKKTCAKLSLISVYNMALTYHLAALDTDSSNQICNQTNNKENYLGNRSKKRKNKSESRPSKKTKLSNKNNAYIPATTSSLDGRNNKLIVASPAETNSTIGTAQTSTTATANDSVPKCNNRQHNTASVDRVLLGQALAYYQIAYRILVSEQRVLVSQAMVILNNIGHIHRLLGREECAKSCFQRLLTTMVYIQQTGDHHQISHWDSFLTNVIDLIVAPEASHKRFAPAA